MAREARSVPRPRAVSTVRATPAGPAAVEPSPPKDGFPETSLKRPRAARPQGVLARSQPERGRSRSDGPRPRPHGLGGPRTQFPDHGPRPPGDAEPGSPDPPPLCCGGRRAAAASAPTPTGRRRRRTRSPGTPLRTPSGAGPHIGTDRCDGKPARPIVQLSPPSCCGCTALSLGPERDPPRWRHCSIARPPKADPNRRQTQNRRCSTTRTAPTPT